VRESFCNRTERDTLTRDKIVAAERELREWKTKYGITSESSMEEREIAAAVEMTKEFAAARELSHAAADAPVDPSTDPGTAEAVSILIRRDLERQILSEIGRRGGQVKSERKARAARENGKKGGGRRRSRSRKTGGE